MKAYKFKCLKCKETTNCQNGNKIFTTGCPLCGSKKIEVKGYGEEGGQNNA